LGAVVGERKQRDGGGDHGDADEVGAPVVAASRGGTVVDEPGDEDAERRPVGAECGQIAEQLGRVRARGGGRGEDEQRRQRAEATLEVGSEDPDGQHRDEPVEEVRHHERGRQQAPPLVVGRASEPERERADDLHVEQQRHHRGRRDQRDRHDRPRLRGDARDLAAADARQPLAAAPRRLVDLPVRADPRRPPAHAAAAVGALGDVRAHLGATVAADHEQVRAVHPPDAR
jgi:hypothetical protein